MEQNWQIYSEREVNLVRPREEKKKKKPLKNDTTHFHHPPTRGFSVS